MCPACLSLLAIGVTATTSAGGLAAIATNVIRRKRAKRNAQAKEQER
jgi:hypothetical protein